VILDAVAAGIDLSAPTCLLMGFLLHFFTPGAARNLVAQYATALAPGSYVVLSVGRGDHSVADFASFFGPLELVPPGMVDAREWHPDWEQAVHLPPHAGQVIVGVARRIGNPHRGSMSTA
jgi:O-methyltransferase involved in polyketide biosynthesis